MLKMKSTKLNQAAKEYAKYQLGVDQFKNNKDAVKAISEDFKAGVSWAKKNYQLTKQ